MTAKSLLLALPLASLPAILAAAPPPHTGVRSAPAATVRRAAPGVVEIGTGRGRLVTLSQPMSDLFIANPDIADVQVRSATQLYVFGKKTGETTISATAKGGQVVYAATVRVANNIDSMGAMLAMAMPDAHVVATPLNGLVLLTGTVAAPADAAEAERLVQAYVGADVKVLSRLKTATPLQVMLQVRIAEVSRSFVKNIGNRLTARGGSVSTDSGTGSAGAITYTDAPVLNPTTGAQVINPVTGLYETVRRKTSTYNVSGVARQTLGIAGHALGLDFIDALDLGETNGQVSTLANPNLTALSGETATFLAGGEIPIPISQGLGAVSVEYKQYGISLAFTPTVLSDGRISLRVRPEVSQLSSAGSVQISGTTIPALSTRRVETSAELGSGQSMMIGGLLSNSHDNSIDKVPGVGDVPVLGALFRSNAWKRNETELVIVITPYLVKPVDNQADIALPTDGEKAPTDLQRVLLGKLGDGTTGGRRPVPTMAPGTVTAPAFGAAAPVSPAPAAPTPAAPMPAAPTPAAVAPAPRKTAAAATPGFSN